MWEFSLLHFIYCIFILISSLVSLIPVEIENIHQYITCCVHLRIDTYSNRNHPTASHNCIKEDEAKRLGLTVEKIDGRLKTVNSKAKPLNEVALDVELHQGSWQGKANFFFVPLNDFSLVLGMEFLR